MRSWGLMNYGFGARSSTIKVTQIQVPGRVGNIAVEPLSDSRRPITG